MLEIVSKNIVIYTLKYTHLILLMNLHCMIL